MAPVASFGGVVLFGAGSESPVLHASSTHVATLGSTPLPPPLGTPGPGSPTAPGPTSGGRGEPSPSPFLPSPFPPSPFSPSLSPLPVTPSPAARHALVASDVTICLEGVAIYLKEYRSALGLLGPASTGRCLVDTISNRIEPGQMFAILGGSGSGKVREGRRRLLT